MKRKLRGSFLLIPLILASCSSKQNQAHLFVYDTKDAFLNEMTENLASRMEEKGVELKIHDAERKQSTQNSDVMETLPVSTGPLFLNLVDRLSASLILEKAEQNDCPLLFVNREPLTEDIERSAWSKQNTFYVGADPSYQGLAQSQIVGRYLPKSAEFASSPFDKNGDGKLQIVLFRGELSHQDAESRTRYCLNGLRSQGFDLDILEVCYADWEREKGYEFMKRIDLNEENVELLLSNNDEMALGAIDYLLEKNPDREDFIAHHFPIVGVDGTEEGKKAVDEGLMLGTVINDAEMQASILASLYFSFLEGTSLPEGDEKTSVDGNFYRVRGEIYSRI